MKNLFICMLFLSSASVVIASGYKGSVSFTQEEKNYHKKNLSDFGLISSQCINAYWTSHIEFYHNNCKTINGQRRCLSKYFGDRRYSKVKNAVRSDGEPLVFLDDALKRAGFPVSYSRQMTNTSCVGMAMKCLKKAFYETNQPGVWQRIEKFTKANGVGGTALQEALRKLGWKVFYWNPIDKERLIEKAREWDKEEKNWKSKGWHEYRYVRMKQTGKYWYNNVDDQSSMVGFGTQTPDVLNNAPFWVGIAHTGYHVFPGTYNTIIEAHSTRHITSIDNLETSEFSPLKLGGGHDGLTLKNIDQGSSQSLHLTAFKGQNFYALLSK